MELILLFVSFLLVVGGVIYLTERKTLHRQIELCEQQAHRLGGYVIRGWLPIVYPTLIIPYGNHSAAITMQPGQKSSPGYTTGAVKLHCPRHVHLDVAQGMVNFAGMFSGGRRWKSGDRDFDSRFKTNSNDAQFTQHLLSTAFQHELLRLAAQLSGCRLTLTHDMFEISVKRLLKDEHQYALFLDVLCACMAQVHICTQIRTVRFEASHAPMTVTGDVLWNPEVEQFDTPPFGLERIEIHGATYDFHQVERFMTYLIDALGPHHLKQGVEVILIGQVDNIHSNLRNGFHNICRCVREMDEIRQED